MIRSRSIVKIDAVDQLFPDDLAPITWAVVDTGIDSRHPAFRNHSSDDPNASRVVLTIDIRKGLTAQGDPAETFQRLVGDESWTRFLLSAMDSGSQSPGQPRYGETSFGTVTPPGGPHDDHGTHVAGIIGADAIGVRQIDPLDNTAQLPERIRGMHPTVNLVDIKVFGDGGVTDEFSVIVALALIRWLNDGDRYQQISGARGRINGVNLSLSAPFDANKDACGWTPLCQEVDRLVKSGVVVVAAAGNAGWDARYRSSPGVGYRMVSITDPGNTESAITVGATDSTSPYRHGPIGLSSRGPTADGRHKPDLLAPGRQVVGPAPGGGWVIASGTSQAAAHVSGVASRLLARFPELIGQPERVKQILMSSASDLGRLPDFQGSGLVDALRAMQATWIRGGVP